MISPQVNTTPCANHGESSAVRQHCPSAPGEACKLETGLNPACHVACYCRHCDHQWVEPCNEHQVAA